MIRFVIYSCIVLEVRCACEHAIILRSGASFCGDAQLRSNDSQASFFSRALGRCPGSFEVKDAPFVWAASPKDMTVGGDTIQEVDGRIFVLNDAVQNGLAKSCREDERSVAASARDMNRVRSLFETFSPGRGQQEYHKVFVNREGWIVDPIACHALRNGGCTSDEPWQAWGDHGMSTRSFPRVLTIASRWGSEPWHFPMEGLAALANTKSNVLLSKDLFIHVSAKTSYTVAWLDIVGIVASRVLEGELFAETLLVPQMGGCGNPSRSQLNFLRRAVSGMTSASSFSFLRPAHPTRKVVPNSLVLVKRSLRNGRTVLNHDSVLEPFAERFASAHGLSVHIHDDDHLPPLREQLQHFARAVITVAPHGAALVLLLAAPTKAGVVEIIDMADNSICKVCYMRLAFFLGFNYSAIPLQAGLVKALDLQRSLDRLMPEAF